MKKIFIFYLFFIFSSWNLLGRNIGETEITTEDGIEVFQNEKFYLLKKNVQINSDTFILSGDEVKVFFDKDLYDITTIFAKGKVILDSETNSIKAKGDFMEIFINDEKILVKGINSRLNLEEISMISDGNIQVSNKDETFSLKGPNSNMSSENIDIKGQDIKGQFSTINGKKNIIKLNVLDDKISNIKTSNIDMYAKKVTYDKKNSIIELFENVKVIRGNEIITGDYGTLDTANNSYKVKSNNSKKVKVLITENNE